MIKIKNGTQTNGTIKWEDVFFVLEVIANEYGFYTTPDPANILDFITFARDFMNTYNNNQILTKLPKTKTTQEVNDEITGTGEISMYEILSIFELGCIEKSLYTPDASPTDDKFLDWFRADLNAKTNTQVVEAYMA
jgi:hypothetical protein